MIYKFRLITNEEDSFICDIEISKESTFLDFNDIILKTMNYETSALTSFYLCDDDWEKQEEISLMDMGDENSDQIVMKDAIIENYLNKKKQHLIFVFDLLNERCFFIELIGAIKKDKKSIYPRCSILKGKIPDQFKFDDIEP